MPKKRKYQQGGRIIQGDLVTPGGPGSKSTIDTTKPLKQLNLSNITGPTADMGPSGGFKWGRTSGHVLYNVDRDPYTKYIPEADIEDFRFQTTGNYGGIGSTIRKIDESVVIYEPYKDFPADKSV